MNNEEIDYKKEYEQLQLENQQLKEKLKKYTNPERNKKYYEKHKEELKLRNYKRSSSKSTKEQRKIWNKKYYEKKKLEKLKNTDFDAFETT